MSSMFQQMVATMQAQLHTHSFGRIMRAFPEVTSTNTLAATWAREGAPEGALIVADFQTRGRGRLNRSWESDEGQNLTFSIILRPSLAPARLGLISLCASVAVADTLAHLSSGFNPRIKWPNDVWLNERKCCGILSVARLEPPEVILGIGLNVNQIRFPAHLHTRATSLAIESGTPWFRATVLATLLQHLEQSYHRLLNDQGQVLRRRYHFWLYGIGQNVRFRRIESTRWQMGKMVGIDDIGALQIETQTGVHTFHAGDITFQEGLTC